MEIAELEKVKIENSVIIRGLTNTELDEDYRFSRQVWSYLQTPLHNDSKQPYHRDVIVEYKSCSAVVAFKTLLSYTFKSSQESATDS